MRSSYGAVAPAFSQAAAAHHFRNRARKINVDLR